VNAGHKTGGLVIGRQAAEKIDDWPGCSLDRLAKRSGWLAKEDLDEWPGGRDD